MFVKAKDGSVSRSGSKKSKNQQNFKSSRHCTTFCNSFVLYRQKICVEEIRRERSRKWKVVCCM